MGCGQPDDGHKEPENVSEIEDDPGSQESQGFFPAASKIDPKEKKIPDEKRPAEGELVESPVKDVVEE